MKSIEIYDDGDDSLLILVDGKKYYDYHWSSFGLDEVKELLLMANPELEITHGDLDFDEE